MISSSDEYFAGLAPAAIPGNRSSTPAKQGQPEDEAHKRRRSRSRVQKHKQGGKNEAKNSSSDGVSDCGNPSQELLRQVPHCAKQGNNAPTRSAQGGDNSAKSAGKTNQPRSSLKPHQQPRNSKVTGDTEDTVSPPQSKVKHGPPLDARKMVRVDFGEEIPYENLDAYLSHLFKCSSSSFKIVDVCDHGESANCILLGFESAQDVKAFLESKNNEFTIVCADRCSEERFCAAQSERNLLAEFTAKSKIPIARHKKKLREFEDRYKSEKSKAKKLSISASHVAAEEIGAIACQLTILKHQLMEFEFFLRLVGSQLEKTEEITKMSMQAFKNGFVSELKKFETAFPIYAHKSEITDLVKKEQVSILLGETGSGKSTQVVQYLLSAGFAENGMIICTQPRKVSAISLAERVSSELDSPVGELVGYHVGMQRKSSKHTKIVYMTDSCLLNVCRNDPLFKEYSCIIIDEANERSLQTDLLLGMVKRCLPLRPELRVIVTSATIMPDVFVAFFGGAPVYKVSGKTYPVDVIYDKGDVVDAQYQLDYVERAVAKTLEIHKEDRDNLGDILVFLTSGLETEKAMKSLQSQLPKDFSGPKANVLQLHGRLPPEEQRRAFEPTPPGCRKIVFATNVAETSVTIPGVRFIVDTGMVKSAAFDHKRNMHILKVREISKSSAQQRKGRAGRTAPGRCYRLYSETSFEKMDDMAKPEILCTHVGSAILQLLSYGICDCHEFDFVESPPPEAMTNAMMLLEGLGACLNGKLTDLGKQMAVLPMEPRLAKLLLKGIQMDYGMEAAIMTAICTVGGSIFFSAGTLEQRQECDK